MPPPGPAGRDRRAAGSCGAREQGAHTGGGGRRQGSRVVLARACALGFGRGHGSGARAPGEQRPALSSPWRGHGRPGPARAHAAAPAASPRARLFSGACGTMRSPRAMARGGVRFGAFPPSRRWPALPSGHGPASRKPAAPAPPLRSGPADAGRLIAAPGRSQRAAHPHSGGGPWGFGRSRRIAMDRISKRRARCAGRAWRSEGRAA